MFAVIKNVAGNYGVIDTEDGVIEWLSKADLQRYISSGVQIGGVSNTGITPVRVTIPAQLCNWNNGENIFLTGSLFTESASGDFKFRSGKKTYKGKIIHRDSTSYGLLFSLNVVVVVDIQLINKMRIQ